MTQAGRKIGRKKKGARSSKRAASPTGDERATDSSNSIESKLKTARRYETMPIVYLGIDELEEAARHPKIPARNK